MDYPQLNLLFGLILSFTLVVNISLRVLLTKVRLSVWLSRLSWVALFVSIVSTALIEILFLQFMSPSFNGQIAFGLLVIGGVGAVVTASLYRKEIPLHIARFLLGAQVLTSLVSVFLALGLYRSLIPI